MSGKVVFRVEADHKKSKKKQSRWAYGKAVSEAVIHLNEIIVKWSNSPKSNRQDFQTLM